MSTFFVRSRGKLAGPFDVGALQQMAKRGRLTRFDQVSTDRTSWRSAGEISELFPQVQRKSPAPVASATAVAEDDEYALADAPPRSVGNRTSHAGSGASFFYAQNGIAVGPVALDVLRMLATNGTLRADDQVWADGSDIATPARQVPMLASLYTAGNGRVLGHAGRSDGSASAAHLDEGSAQAAIAGSQRQAKVFHIVCASAIILLTLMPVAIYNGTALWWWNTNGWGVASNVYTLVSSIAILIVAPLAAGAARPITIFSLVTTPLCIAFVLAVAHTSGPGDPPLVVILACWGMLAFAVATLAINHVRGKLDQGGPTSAGVTQIIFASLLGVSTILGIISLILAGQELQGAPGGAVAIFALSCIAVLATLASGILGILAGARRPMSRALNMASTICAWAGGGLICGAIASGVVFAASSLSGVVDAKGQTAMVYIVFRVAFLVIATLTLVSVSLSELLMWINRRYASV